MSRRRMLVLAVIAVLASVTFIGVNSVGAAAPHTQIGAIGLDVEAVTGLTDGDDWGIVTSLKSPAKTIVTDDDVSVKDDQALPGASSDESGTCTGTFSAPTAPNDKVCVYLSNADNVVDVHGVSIVPGTGGSRHGFKVVFSTATDNEDAFFEAVWAYRHPG